MGRKREIGSRLTAQISLRLPGELRKQIEEAADISGRSKNTEIIIRLEESFATASSSSDMALSQEIRNGFDDLKRELADVRRELAASRNMTTKKK